MSIIGKIGTLMRNGIPLFPMTKTKAVTNDKGESLDAIMQKYQGSEDGVVKKADDATHADSATASDKALNMGTIITKNEAPIQLKGTLITVNLNFGIEKEGWYSVSATAGVSVSSNCFMLSRLMVNKTVIAYEFSYLPVALNPPTGVNAYVYLKPEDKVVALLQCNNVNPSYAMTVNYWVQGVAPVKVTRT